jgi:NADPH-dependent curcumin reductase CurA
MKSRTICKVIRSEDPDFHPGDYALAPSGGKYSPLLQDIHDSNSFNVYLDWSLHVVFTKTDGLTKLQKPANVSLSTYAGVLGLPAMTAFLSIRKFGKMKAGETLFVSTAAGVVGR